MGKALTALFGRTSKLTSLLQDTITRSTFLKNRHHSLLSITNSDVVELLKLDRIKEAFLRVEHVIKSTNMIETLSIVESYCHFLVERVSQVERNKDYPEELREALSSLIFASSRIGEFPELKHIRDYFTTKFGKEYVSQCIEFPLYSSVNDKIVQNLSRRKPSSETRMNFLKGIASENGITLLHLDIDFQHVGSGEEKGKPSTLSRNTLTITQALQRGG